MDATLQWKSPEIALAEGERLCPQRRVLERRLYLAGGDRVFDVVPAHGSVVLFFDTDHR